MATLTTFEDNPQLKCLPLITFAEYSQQICYISQDKNYYEKDEGFFYDFTLSHDLTKAYLSKDLPSPTKDSDETKQPLSDPPPFLNAEVKLCHNITVAIQLTTQSKEADIEHKLTLTLKPWSLFHELTNDIAINIAGLEILQKHFYFKDFHICFWRCDKDNKTVVMSFKPKHELTPDYKDYNHIESLKRVDNVCNLKPDSQLIIPPWGRGIVINCEDYLEDQKTMVRVKNRSRLTCLNVLSCISYPVKDAWTNGFKDFGGSWKSTSITGVQFLLDMYCTGICKSISSDEIRDQVQLGNFITQYITEKLKKSDEKQINNCEQTDRVKKKKYKKWNQKNKSKTKRSLHNKSETRMDFCIRQCKTAGKTQIKAKELLISTGVLFKATAAGATSKTTNQVDDIIEINSIDILNQIGRNNSYPHDGHYKITNNIDAKGFNNTIPIFTGSIDGQSFTITNLNRCLFGKVKNQEKIKNINFCNAHIINSTS